MDNNQKALSALSSIKKMEFTSYNDFLRKAIDNGTLLSIKNALGEIHMYRVVCEICGEEVDECFAETLSS